jgi:antitoxin (DNA-binding transcriptional repressor) of toxin-antitoxin stability system
MRKVNISTFKANCLGILRELHKHGGSLTITNREQPIAELRAISKHSKPRELGTLKDTIKITGDIMNSFSEEEWDSLS